MIKFTTLRAMETDAQFATTRSADIAITTKPNVLMLCVFYNGNAEFEYLLKGPNGMRETSREFAHDILTQEIKNHGK